MKYNTLKTSLNDGILTITMNRPSKKNAMTPEMMTDLANAFDEAATDNEVVFVVLTGAGDYYCSGNDLSSTADKIDRDSVKELIINRLTMGKRIVDSFIDFPKLLIALVNGPSIGIATTTLGLCDLVYCTTNATFWAPFSTLGLSAEGCSSYVFPRIMGDIKANEMLQLGKKITAVEAKDCGLVLEVYQPADVDTVLWPKLYKMRKTLSAGSLLVNKKLIRRWELETLHAVNKLECEELGKISLSDDFIRWMQRFLQGKSKPTNKL